MLAHPEFHQDRGSFIIYDFDSRISPVNIGFCEYFEDGSRMQKPANIMFAGFCGDL